MEGKAALTLCERPGLCMLVSLYVSVVCMFGKAKPRSNSSTYYFAPLAAGPGLYYHRRPPSPAPTTPCPEFNELGTSPVYAGVTGVRVQEPGYDG